MSYSIYINDYKISYKNLLTHKFGEKQDGGTVVNTDHITQTYFVKCKICGLAVFEPDADVSFHTTFDVFEDFSCDEYIVKNIIE